MVPRRQGTIEDLLQFGRTQRKIELKAFQLVLPDWMKLFRERRQRVKLIDGFWPIALKHSEVLDSDSCAEDWEVLSQLEDVWLEWEEDNVQNFTVQFWFSDNTFTPEWSPKKSFWYNEKRGKLESEPVEVPWKSRDLIEEYGFNSSTYSIFNWFAYSCEDNSLADVAPMIEDFYIRAHHFWQLMD